MQHQALRGSEAGQEPMGAQDAGATSHFSCFFTNAHHDILQAQSGGLPVELHVCFKCKGEGEEKYALRLLPLLVLQQVTRTLEVQ